MNLLNKIFGGEDHMPEDSTSKLDDTPEFHQNKKYIICTEDNPNQKRYRCGKKDIISPDCKLSLALEEITREEMMELDLEIRNMLDRHNFEMR
jgi:hypothetical protein